MERIKKRFGFINGINVSSDGSRGRHCLGWKEGFLVDLRSFNASYIDVMINDLQASMGH